MKISSVENLIPCGLYSKYTAQHKQLHIRAPTQEHTHRCQNDLSLIQETYPGASLFSALDMNLF